MIAITAEQIRDLFHGHISTIDRGDEYDMIKREDVLALVDNGDLDRDEDGTPTEEMWQILADSLSDAPADGPRERALAAIADAVYTLNRAEAERDAAIRSAIAAGASVISIAAEAELSRSRIYQIRDGRR